jgi:hypothetical protein
VSVNDNPIPLPRMGGNFDDGDDIGGLMGPFSLICGSPLL